MSSSTPVVDRSARASSGSPRTPTATWRVGKGRRGLLLEIWPIDAAITEPDACLFRHASSETYRRHSEARDWVEKNLRRPR